MFLDQNKNGFDEMPIIKLPNREFYLCANYGDSFEIRVEKAENTPESTYAPKLFIDGDVFFQYTENIGCCWIQDIIKRMLVSWF